MMVVVDTNVALVANKCSEQASEDCVESCVEWLEKIMGDVEKLVLDDQWEIIREYQNKLDPSGEPRVGNRFLKWVLTNRYNTERCELVSITPIIDKGTVTYQEFPSDSELIGFDPDNRKFVAVALAHSQHPSILQAVDIVWWKFKETLLRYDVEVEFLCENDIRRMLARNV